MIDLKEFTLNIMKLNVLKFEIEVDKYILGKNDEEKTAILQIIRKHLKEEKEKLTELKRITLDNEEKIILKSKIKKIKKKIFMINSKVKLFQTQKETLKKSNGLSSVQKNIEMDILNKEDISKYNIKDIMVTFNYLINEKFVLENYEVLQNYARIISLELQDYLNENDEIFREFHILLNTLKLKINNSLKDSKERECLKKIYLSFKNVYAIYKKENIVNDNSSYFDVISYWLNDEKNYLYIKELLKRRRDLVNISSNNKHIVIYILDLYIHNFKRMVNDKNSDYINLKYIEEVYYLFTKNSYLKISEKEKEEIDLKIKELENYIDKTILKQKRKNYAKSVIKKMKTNKFYQDHSYYTFPNFNDDFLGYYQVTLTNGLDYITRNKEAHDAYLYGRDVYNISKKDDGKIVLNIYTISFYSHIPVQCEIDKYLEKCEMLNEEVDSFFKKELVFKEGNIYPVINYELEFYPSGKFYGLDVKEDIIKVNNMSEDIQMKFLDLYKKSFIKNKEINTEDVNDHFESILQILYLEFLKNERLPYIYFGKTLPKKEETEKTINDISCDLYEMEKNDYSEIINIISNEIDNYHYSNLPIENAKYQLNLLNPISYLGIENQRMLADLYFNKRKLDSNEKIHNLKLEYLHRYIKMVEELNLNLGYVDYNLIKQNKGRIKNKIRL